MASLVNAALGAITAAAFWTLLGYAVSRRVFPRPLALGAAGRSTARRRCRSSR